MANLELVSKMAEFGPDSGGRVKVSVCVCVCVCVCVQFGFSGRVQDLVKGGPAPLVVRESDSRLQRSPLPPLDIPVLDVEHSREK